jgi:hypothetical protein
MGKLAERLSDPQRTGIYRVETTEALEEAVALNAFALVRLHGPRFAPEWEACLTPRDDGRVLLFTGCGRLARHDPHEWASLTARLGAAAVEHRAAGLRFFAVFLDPEAALPLAPLYNWLRKPKEETHGTDEAGSEEARAAQC